MISLSAPNFPGVFFPDMICPLLTYGFDARGEKVRQRACRWVDFGRRTGMEWLGGLGGSDESSWSAVCERKAGAERLTALL